MFRHRIKIKHLSAIETERRQDIQMLRLSKVYGYSSSQCNLPHRYGNLHAIWDHTVLPATRQRWHSRLTPTEAGTRLSDHGGMQGWVDLVGLLHAEMVYPPEDGHPSSTNRARRALTSFMRRTPLTTMPRRQRSDARLSWLSWVRTDIEEQRWKRGYYTCVEWRTCRRTWRSVTAWYASSSTTRPWVEPAASAACWHPHPTVRLQGSLLSSSIAHLSTLPAPSRRLAHRHDRAASCLLVASHSPRTANSVRMFQICSQHMNWTELQSRTCEF